MRIPKFVSLLLVFCLSLTAAIGCNPSTETPTPDAPSSSDATSAPLVLGYSNWAGWWPWAIAEEEGLFAANGANVELRWFDGYLESMEAFAVGQLDANCQTLNDTISFAADAVNGEVVVLVNDNSAGNDKVIVTEEITTIQDLAGRNVGLEEGVVGDFLLTLALEEAGMSRSDVNIRGLETGEATAAFAAGQLDAVAAWPPYWLTALQLEGSKELLSSQDYPGAIPDLLVVSQVMIDERPDQVQALVNTWFDVLAFMDENPDRAQEIMAQRADVSLDEFQLFTDGTRMFTLEDNLEAFSPGEDMKHMPFAAQRMADFMTSVGFITEDKVPDLDAVLDDRFVQAYAASNS
ncbi:MAG TPA: ABC transporter substrate-binding protein [Candidatus Obscuribacterales bacterium]